MNKSNAITLLEELKDFLRDIGCGEIYGILGHDAGGVLGNSILYNMKGARMEGIKGLEDLTSMDYKTGYLEVPVQVQAGVNLGLARVYGFAEPFVGYALSNEVHSNLWKEPKETWDNVKSRLEYGIGLGVGVELIKHVQVAVKYYWNMGDMYGAELSFAGFKNTIAEQKASGIAASVALLF